MNAVVAYGICLNPWALIVVFAEFLPIPMPAALYGAIYIGNDVMAVRCVRAHESRRTDGGSIDVWHGMRVYFDSHDEPRATSRRVSILIRICKF